MRNFYTYIYKKMIEILISLTDFFQLRLIYFMIKVWDKAGIKTSRAELLGHSQH